MTKMINDIDVIDNIIQAISILNKTDEYLDSLTDKLSDCDCLLSDYYHLIEFENINEIDIAKLFEMMKQTLETRRKIKDDMQIGKCLNIHIEKIKNLKNIEFLIQELKKSVEKLPKKYTNRILTDEQIEELKTKEIKKHRGRPKKEKE